MRSQYRPVHCTLCGWKSKRRYQKHSSFNCPRCGERDIIGNVVPSEPFDYEDNPHAGKVASVESKAAFEELNLLILKKKLGL